MSGETPAAPELHEILQGFMQSPAPMALAKVGGEIVLANPSWSARFGTAKLVAGFAAGDDCRLVLQEGVEALARAIRMPDRILLVVDEPRGPNLQAEVEKLRERISMLERLAATDHLTGA